MAAPSIAVSQTVTLVANAEQHVTSNHIYATIVVDNSGDAAGTITGFEVYVCTDGGTAGVAGAHCEMVPYGQTRVFSNLQPLPNSNVVGSAAKYSAGVDGSFSQSEAVGWTAQTGYTVTNGTFCSVVSAGTPNVTITFE